MRQVRYEGRLGISEADVEPEHFHIQPGELSVYFDQTTVGESGGAERSSTTSVSDYINGDSLFNKVVYLCRDVFHYCQTVRITIWTVQFLPRITLQSCSPFHGCQLRWFTGPISKLFVQIKHLDIALCKYVCMLGNKGFRCVAPFTTTWFKPPEPFCCLFENEAVVCGFCAFHISLQLWSALHLIWLLNSEGSVRLSI